MIRDRIVVGVRDDTTRDKLLQIRDLTMAKAIDECKASEAAGKRLKAMTNAAEEVQALHGSTKHRRRRMETGGRNSKNDQRQRRRKTSTAPTKPRARCKYCGGKHEPTKEACPAYGKTCRRCSKQNHFESVCMSKNATSHSLKHNVNELDTDEELLIGSWTAPIRPDGTLA